MLCELQSKLDTINAELKLVNESITRNGFYVKDGVVLLDEEIIVVDYELYNQIGMYNSDFVIEKFSGCEIANIGLDNFDSLVKSTEFINVGFIQNDDGDWDNTVCLLDVNNDSLFSYSLVKDLSRLS